MKSNEIIVKLNGEKDLLESDMNKFKGEQNDMRRQIK